MTFFHDFLSQTTFASNFFSIIFLSSKLLPSDLSVGFLADKRFSRLSWNFYGWLFLVNLFTPMTLTVKWSLVLKLLPVKRFSKMNFIHVLFIVTLIAVGRIIVRLFVTRLMVVFLSVPVKLMSEDFLLWGLVYLFILFKSDFFWAILERKAFCLGVFLLIF